MVLVKMPRRRLDRCTHAQAEGHATIYLHLQSNTDEHSKARLHTAFIGIRKTNHESCTAFFPFCNSVCFFVFASGYYTDPASRCWLPFPFRLTVRTMSRIRLAWGYGEDTEGVFTWIGSFPAYSFFASVRWRRMHGQRVGTHMRKPDRYCSRN